MRIGLVGLSSPLLYDYGVQATRAPSDLADSPNPVLDSPFGLMLLYDELWFLCRSLCPENMRSLDFVRFLDEEGMLPDLGDLDPHRLWTDPPSAYARLVDSLRTWFSNFDEVAKSLRMSWDARPDNHTHGLQLGQLQITADSFAPQAIIFDLEVLERLQMKNVELVGNTFGQSLMEGASPMVSDANLAHVLVIDRIPNYLTPQGPYHPVIREAREDRFLKYFRRWISDTATSTSVSDASQFKAEVEKRIQETQDQLLLSHLDPRRMYLSTAKTLAGAIADLVAPWAGTGGSLIAELREARAAKHSRWQGFLVSFARATTGHQSK